MQLFSTECELVHTSPSESRASCSSTDGLSRFQYPGLARSLTVYCVDGLVFLPGFWTVAPRTPTGRTSRKQVICVRTCLQAECASQKKEGCHERRTPANL